MQGRGEKNLKSLTHLCFPLKDTTVPQYPCTIKRSNLKSYCHQSNSVKNTSVNVNLYLAACLCNTKKAQKFTFHKKRQARWHTIPFFKLHANEVCLSAGSEVCPRVNCLPARSQLLFYCIKSSCAKRYITYFLSVWTKSPRKLCQEPEEFILEQILSKNSSDVPSQKPPFKSPTLNKR